MTEAAYASPLGIIAARCEGNNLVGLRFDEAANAVGQTLSENIRRWLDEYFSGHDPSFTPLLSLHGTAFQRRVWTALLSIPFGSTVTYGELAQHVGCRSAQAVGQAVGHNPVAIIVPCHRVVGSNGSLTGYAYGLQRKQWLLQMERETLHKLKLS